MKKIGIVGAGAFGTALASALATDGRNVTLVDRDEVRAAEIDANRVNPRLPGHVIPDGVKVTGEFAHLDDAEAVLLAVPTQALRGFLTRDGGLLPDAPLVSCAKGADRETGMLPSEIIASAIPGARVAVLTGPGFASEIAEGKPTALTLAAREPGLGQNLQELLSTRTLRLYRTDDVTGAELGGALKNVIAIACGLAIGAGLGESARAAIMTRGFAEMRRFAQALGARPETLTGLSGLGDLSLTSTSPLSRNFSFGRALGAGGVPPEGRTVEGIATAGALAEKAAGLGIDMPITRMVAAIVTRRITVNEAAEALLARPLKEEM